MELAEASEQQRKRAPTFASMYGKKRSNSVSSFCRITGKSRSMDEHHYVFSSDDFPRFDNVCGCRITEKHGHFKDYRYLFPVLDVDGVTRMVTEHDFHCRITAKYKAMAGHRYVYPVLGAKTDKTVEDMVSVVDSEDMREVIVPSEVEHIIRGGIKDVMKVKDGEHLFIQSKEGAMFPAATKEIFKRKAEPLSKRPRRHTLPITLEASIVSELVAICMPTIKLVGDLKAPLVEITAFDVIPESTEILKDVRKFRPKRPGKSKNRPGSGERKRIQVPRDIQSTETSKQPPPRLSRLDSFKKQFQSFEENYSFRSTGSRLTDVGAFNEDEMEELDFSEPTEIRFTESRILNEKRAVLTEDVAAVSSSAQTDSKNIMNGSNATVEKWSEVNEISQRIVNGAIQEDLQLSPTNHSFQEIKALVGSKLDLCKTLKLGKSSACLEELNNNAANVHLAENAVETSTGNLSLKSCEDKTEMSNLSSNHDKMNESDEGNVYYNIRRNDTKVNGHSSLDDDVVLKFEPSDNEAVVSKATESNLCSSSEIVAASDFVNPLIRSPAEIIDGSNIVYENGQIKRFSAEFGTSSKMESRNWMCASTGDGQVAQRTDSLKEVARTRIPEDSCSSTAERQNAAVIDCAGLNAAYKENNLLTQNEKDSDFNDYLEYQEARENAEQQAVEDSGLKYEYRSKQYSTLMTPRDTAGQDMSGSYSALEKTFSLENEILTDLEGNSKSTQNRANKSRFLIRKTPNYVTNIDLGAGTQGRCPEPLGPSISEVSDRPTFDELPRYLEVRLPVTCTLLRNERECAEKNFISCHSGTPLSGANWSNGSFLQVRSV